MVWSRTRDREWPQSYFLEWSWRASRRRWYLSRGPMKWGRWPCSYVRGKPSRWREKMQRRCNANLLGKFEEHPHGHHEKSRASKAMTSRNQGRSESQWRLMCGLIGSASDFYSRCSKNHFSILVTKKIGDVLFYFIFYWLCYYSCPNFYPFSPLQLVPLFSPAILPPEFMSMGSACKFFGFSISYAILHFPLSILFLSIMLLIPYTISPFSHFPADSPPNNLHIYDSVPVLAVCLVCLFGLFLDSAVDSCEFVAFLMFIVIHI